MSVCPAVHARELVSSPTLGSIAATALVVHSTLRLNKVLSIQEVSVHRTLISPSSSPALPAARRTCWSGTRFLSFCSRSATGASSRRVRIWAHSRAQVLDLVWYEDDATASCERQPPAAGETSCRFRPFAAGFSATWGCLPAPY